MTLKDLLGKQYLITAYIEPRLQLANYIKDGYDSNLPILMNNRFLHFTAHTYYRSVILDLYALFGKANNDNKYSFYHLEKRDETTLVAGAIEEIKNWLVIADKEVRTITMLRHRQIAHYDFSRGDAISLNFNHLNEVNTLFALAKRIITFCGASFIDEEHRVGYSFERISHYVHSLDGLIKKASSKP